MPYYCNRPQRIAGTDYAPGDRIPTPVIMAMKQNVVRQLIDMGRIEFKDPDMEANQPTYTGRGWWTFPNGMKVRSGKDKRPTLTEALAEA